MKTIGAILILFTVLYAKAQTVQYVTLTYDNNLPVQTNQLVSVVGYDWVDAQKVNWNITIQGTMPNGKLLDLTPYSFNYYGGTGDHVTYSSQIPQIVTGLTNIYVISGINNFNGWATFKIETPHTANVISNYVPADAIVIPTSATGNAQIILESSADLINWTAASPGIYGMSSATNRFFRVRAAILP